MTDRARSAALVMALVSSACGAHLTNLGILTNPAGVGKIAIEPSPPNIHLRRWDVSAQPNADALEKLIGGKVNYTGFVYADVAGDGEDEVLIGGGARECADSASAPGPWPSTIVKDGTEMIDFNRYGHAHRVVFSVTCGVVLLFASFLYAQSPGTRGFLAGRVGVNGQIVPDGVSYTSVGAGVSAGVFMTPRWAVEFEAWIPGGVEVAGVRYKDMLFSGSAVRFVQTAAQGPYVLVGLGVHRVVWDSGSELAGSVQAGTGFVYRMGDRFSIAPEIRANLVSDVRFLIRPSVTLFYRFP